MNHHSDSYETLTRTGHPTGEPAAHRRSATSRPGGRHGRSGGTHRAGRPRRKGTLLAVTAVLAVGCGALLLIRPGADSDDRALAADQPAPAPSATTDTASSSAANGAAHSLRRHKPSATPSHSAPHGTPHASPRPHTSHPQGSKTSRSTASRAPRTESGPGGGAPAGPRSATGTAARFAQKIVDLVNAQRAQHGCGPLTVDPRLQRAAQAHSDDMAARNFYDHNTPEGIDPGTRMTRAGFPWQSWGENIFKSPKDPATAMDGWMKSPGHRDNILNCSYKSTGVGVNLAANGPWWTQDFATRR